MNIKLHRNSRILILVFKHRSWRVNNLLRYLNSCFQLSTIKCKLSAMSMAIGFDMQFNLYFALFTLPASPFLLTTQNQTIQCSSRSLYYPYIKSETICKHEDARTEYVHRYTKRLIVDAKRGLWLVSNAGQKPILL